MAENKGKFYMTTAIAYTSGKPHIGNTYEIILADAIARYKRAEGYDVYFQTGTDEHGQSYHKKNSQDPRSALPHRKPDLQILSVKYLRPLLFPESSVRVHRFRSENRHHSLRLSYNAQLHPQE